MSLTGATRTMRAPSARRTPSGHFPESKVGNHGPPIVSGLGFRV